MGKFNEELVAAGVMLGGEGVRPSAEGKRVVSTVQAASSRSVYPNGELVAGYWLWEVRDMDEAIEWVKR